jgi:predicted phage terminase large subunit-like protein
LADKSAIDSEVSKKLTERERARTDKIYLAEVLGYDFQADVHSDLFANYLQIDPTKILQDQDTVKDRLVLWSRGFYKTTSVVVEIIQLILNFPDIRILLMQGTVKNTRLLLKEVKSHFDGTNFRSRLQKLFPEFCSPDKRLGAADQFTVPARKRMHLKEPTVLVASPKSVKAGQHFDAGFFDDLINEQNYKNPELVQKAIDDFNHYVPLIDPGGYRYVTGTRYIFGDLYEWIIRHNEKKNWKITIRACWKVGPDGTKTVLFPQRRLPDGRLIGFTLEMLEQFQRDDPGMFAAQYLNMPIAEGERLFTEALLLGAVRSPKAENFPVLGGSILFIDLAASRTNESDHSVILCGRQDGLGRMYACDIRGAKFTPLQLAHATIEMALLHRPLKILVEGTASGTYFVEYLKVIALDRGIVLPVDTIKVSNQKDAKYLRIASVEGVIREGKLFFFPGLPNWESIVEQFTTFPRGRHDDEIDTISLMTQFYGQNGTVRSAPPASRLPWFVTAAPSPNPLLQTAQPDDGGGLGSDFS